jgi:hypothetical protein
LKIRSSVYCEDLSNSTKNLCSMILHLCMVEGGLFKKCLERLWTSPPFRTLPWWPNFFQLPQCLSPPPTPFFFVFHIPPLLMDEIFLTCTTQDKKD